MTATSATTCGPARRKIIGIGREVRARHRDGTEFPGRALGRRGAHAGRPPVHRHHPRSAAPQGGRAARQRVAGRPRAHRPRLGHGRDGRGAGARAQPAAHRHHALPAGRDPDAGSKAEASGTLNARRDLPPGAGQGGPRGRAGRQHHQPHAAFRRKAGAAAPGRVPQRRGGGGRRTDGARPAQSRGSLQRDYAQNLPHAVVDPVQIQQVVVNLLRNAFEAVKGRCRCHRHGDARGATPTMLTVTIEDNGPGLPAQHACRTSSRHFPRRSALEWAWACRFPARSRRIMPET